MVDEIHFGMHFFLPEYRYMLYFSYVHISVYLISTELVFPDKCFAICFLHHLNLYFLVFTLFFFILPAFSTLKSAMHSMQFVPITY